MKAFSGEIQIDAPVETVWSHVTDLARYGEWHPQIPSIRGELQEGEILTLQVTGTARPLRARVLRLVPNRELTILALWPLGLLRPVNTQRVEPLDGNKTRYVYTETFSGPLLPLVARNLARDVAPFYQATCEALKARVEGP
jgi:hypothetical protein